MTRYNRNWRLGENWSGTPLDEGYEDWHGQPPEPKHESRPFVFMGTKKASDECKALGFNSISEMDAWKKKHRKAEDMPEWLSTVCKQLREP